jgi:hypothetical protein
MLKPMKNTLLIALIFLCFNVFGQEKQKAEYKTTKNGVKVYEPSKYATHKGESNAEETFLQREKDELNIDELNQLLQDIDLKLNEIKKNNPDSKDIPVLERKRQDIIEKKKVLNSIDNE